MAIAMGVALALGLVLLAARPADRPATRNALIVLGLCALAEIAEALILSMRGARAAAIAADVANVLVGIVLVRLATIFVFRVALPRLAATAVQAKQHRRSGPPAEDARAGLGQPAPGADLRVFEREVDALEVFSEENAARNHNPCQVPFFACHSMQGLE